MRRATSMLWLASVAARPVRPLRFAAMPPPYCIPPRSTGAHLRVPAVRVQCSASGIQSGAVEEGPLLDAEGNPVPTDASGAYLDAEGAPLSKSALKKMRKAMQVAAKKAANKAAKAAANAGGGGGGTAEGVGPGGSSVEESPAPFTFDDLGIIRSAHSQPAGLEYATVPSLGAEGGASAGDRVRVRGRLAAIRQQGNSCFMVLRTGALHTVQAVFFKDKSRPLQSREFLSRLGKLTEESVIEIEGELGEATVTGCSQQNVEIQIQHVLLVSAAAPKLPFELEDAARSDDQVTASQSTDRPFPIIGQDLRLNNRWIDLRVPSNQAILRIKSSVCALFRQSLQKQGFVELQTPKIVAGESEGGAGVFRTDYFGSAACLAQSPQLYKQMAIAADMERVMEVGPVFRAENSNTRRHLCEFTGLDMEMAFNYHYSEVTLTSPP